eukprot:2476670-Karenia_brevis.AAC.1
MSSALGTVCSPVRCPAFLTSGICVRLAPLQTAHAHPHLRGLGPPSRGTLIHQRPVGTSIEGAIGFNRSQRAYTSPPSWSENVVS